MLKNFSQVYLAVILCGLGACHYNSSDAVPPSPVWAERIATMERMRLISSVTVRDGIAHISVTNASQEDYCIGSSSWPKEQLTNDMILARDSTGFAEFALPVDIKTDSEFLRLEPNDTIIGTARFSEAYPSVTDFSQEMKFWAPFFSC